MVLGGNSVFQSPEGFFGYFLMKESISSYPLKADDEIVLKLKRPLWRKQAKISLMDIEIELPCSEKMTFDSKEEAENTALAADWQHGTKLRAYHCRHCGLWHLASTS